MTKTKKIIKFAKWLPILPIIIGVGIVIATKSQHKNLKQRIFTATQEVRILTLKKTDVIPRAYGYGRARPAHTWSALSQVGGQIVYVDPKLRKGEIINANVEIIHIDAREYKIAIEQITANTKAIQAQLKEVDISEENNQELLKLEKENLDLQKRELNRQKGLVTKDVTAKSAFERQQQNYIQQKYRVRSLQNSLALIPAKRQLLLAQLEQAKAKLANAKLKLSYTKISTPYQAIVSEVLIEEKQYIPPGQVLVRVDAVKTMEVETRIWKGLRPLVPVSEYFSFEKAMKQSHNFLKSLGISAIVRWKSTDQDLQWPAVFSRFSGDVDPQTRSFGVIVEVSQPEKFEKNGPRPLIKGMDCEVEFRGRKHLQRIIIPRTSVYDNNIVYIVDGNKLAKRTIVIDYYQKNFVVIKSGLKEGEKLILSQVVPAVDGILIETTEEQQWSRRFYKEASEEN